jgi:hypothetical protein
MARSPLESLVDYIREEQAKVTRFPYPPGTPTLARLRYEEVERPQASATIRAVIGELTGYDPVTGKPTYAREKYEWEKPWQEKLWQYQLNKPYFAPDSGADIATVSLQRTKYLNEVLASAVEGVTRVASAGKAVDHDELDRTVAAFSAYINNMPGLTADEKAKLIRAVREYREQAYPRPTEQPRAGGGLLERLRRAFGGRVEPETVYVDETVRRLLERMPGP